MTVRRPRHCRPCPSLRLSRVRSALRRRDMVASPINRVAALATVAINATAGWPAICERMNFPSRPPRAMASRALHSRLACFRARDTCYTPFSPGLRSIGRTRWCKKTVFLPTDEVRDVDAVVVADSTSTITASRKGSTLPPSACAAQSLRRQSSRTRDSPTAPCPGRGRDRRGRDCLDRRPKSPSRPGTARRRHRRPAGGRNTGFGWPRS